MKTIVRRSLKLGVALVGAWLLLAPLACDQGGTSFSQGFQAHEQGKIDKAIRLYSLSIRQDNLDRTNLSIVYNNRGRAWAAKGEYDKAIADYNQAIELAPKDTNAYDDRGIAWAAKGEYDKAIADYNQAIELNPEFASPYNNRGNAWGDKGEYDKAIADYSRAIELNPKDADVYSNRGSAWADKGEYDKAFADYNRAIELHPRDASIYYVRGNSWAAKGEHDKAIADYSRAIELNPKDANAYNNRGNSWKAKGEYGKAIADYSRAIELSPKQTIAYYNRGVAWVAQGKRDKAIADYNRIIELDPKDASAYWLRGRTYFDCGKFADAVKDFYRCLVLEPGDEYQALWRYIARRRVGQSAGKDLAAFASRYVKDRSAWPGPVFDLFAGRIDSGKCLQAAEPKKPDLADPRLSEADKTARKAGYEKLRREQLCEAYFYVAQYELIRGRTDTARQFLRKCLATNVTMFIEYSGAKAELKRIDLGRNENR